MAGVKHDQPNGRQLLLGKATLDCMPKWSNVMKLRLLVCLSGAMLLAGCVGSVVKTVVAAPIKAAGAFVDATTTSQAEADRNRGREIRKQEERQQKDRKREEKNKAEHPDQNPG
ncbi:hypothetical protein [Aquisediminimonas profunda]|uniref:hypothetical protein n=1 Tax=Aquisediminimonas profunda TaxID=1550733 RepID=UPI001FE9D12C|nr:hypothetical protein [Aquisediminimonas profunda]